MIDLILIGTGALQPLPDRALASAAVTANGRVLLLDCGEGTQSAARRAGVSLVKIDVIALTHFHGDHTYGLPGLLQSMGMGGRTEPVTIIGPTGLEEAMQPFRMLCPFLPFELKLLEISTSPVPMQQFHAGWPANAVLQSFSTAHRVPSQGYRFDLTRSGKFHPEKAKALGVPVTEWKKLQHGESVCVENAVIQPQQVMDEARRGISIAYTGDTAYCSEASNAASDVDVLICEATYAENDQQESAEEHGHMTFAQAAALARESGAHSLWLTHYSPMIDDPESFRNNASCIFDKVVCGYDGLKEPLCYSD